MLKEGLLPRYGCCAVISAIMHLLTHGTSEKQGWKVVSEHPYKVYTFLFPETDNRIISSNEG